MATSYRELPAKYWRTCLHSPVVNGGKKDEPQHLLQGVGTLVDVTWWHVVSHACLAGNDSYDAAAHGSPLWDTSRLCRRPETSSMTKHNASAASAPLDNSDFGTGAFEVITKAYVGCWFSVELGWGAGVSMSFCLGSHGAREAISDFFDSASIIWESCRWGRNPLLC